MLYPKQANKRETKIVVPIRWLAIPVHFIQLFLHCSVTSTSVCSQSLHRTFYYNYHYYHYIVINISIRILYYLSTDIIITVASYQLTVPVDTSRVHFCLRRLEANAFVTKAVCRSESTIMVETFIKCSEPEIYVQHLIESSDLLRSLVCVCFTAEQGEEICFHYCYEDLTLSNEFIHNTV